MQSITIRGARTHNLKNIDLELPRDRLIVITGLSGSGKSSLAFDTLYAEGQRRYVESLSAYARQFLSMMEKPDVDAIEGLSPAISIQQKSTSHNPRSTVGTITEIYDYLRLLYARVGEPRCPTHDITLAAQSVSQMVDAVLEKAEGSRWMIIAPVVENRKGEFVQLLEGLCSQGFIRARIDGEVYELDDPPKLDLRKKHTIEVVVDRFKVKEGLQQRLAESFETALQLTEGIASIISMEDDKTQPQLFSNQFACPQCGYSLSELEPRLFSFNNPVGACPTCDGLGEKLFFDQARIIHNPALSLGAGAIMGWNRQHNYYWQLFQSLAEHYQFDIDLAFEALPKKIQRVILHGSGNELISMEHITEKGKRYYRETPFEGVIPMLERRYRDTDSDLVRDTLNRYMIQKTCLDCQGARLNQAARHVYVKGKTLPAITGLSIAQTLAFFQTLKLTGKSGKIASKILQEIRQRLSFLNDVGLTYLSLSRSAETLSGGEAQRIRLASQIGSGLVGVMYILDEPSIGLHQRDNERLLKTLFRLRDLGNTVIVVEHDEDAIRSADYIVDIGPGAGMHGGEIVAQGTLKQVQKAKNSLTAEYLSGQRQIAIPKQRLPFNRKKILRLTGACGNNLQQINVDIPLGLMTCVTGVSGSGKSTLINRTLYPLAARVLNKADKLTPQAYDTVTGLEHLDKVVDINQSPIGRTPRSNPATYTGMFTPIRELFSAVPEARARGYKPGRFSFNVKGGRCEACQGDGLIKVEMHFLPDVYVICDVCKGKRYNRETLEIKYKGKTIDAVLNMTVEDAHEFFTNIPVIARKLQTLIDVGLSYLTLGQSATTLSGGEAQRIKLARELSRRDTGSTLYILDEPTTGLHFYDIEQLLHVLHRLRDHGNTIIVIEHNLDVIKTADWIIDLGLEGGDEGGQIIATGTPETVAQQQTSHTGRFLAEVLLRY